MWVLFMQLLVVNNTLHSARLRSVGIDRRRCSNHVKDVSFNHALVPVLPYLQRTTTAAATTWLCDGEASFRRVFGRFALVGRKEILQRHLAARYGFNFRDESDLGRPGSGKPARDRGRRNPQHLGKCRGRGFRRFEIF